MKPKSKDLILLAFPDEDRISIDSNTQSGSDFIENKFDSIKENKVNHSNINVIMDEIRKVGLSYSFKLG